MFSRVLFSFGSVLQYYRSQRPRVPIHFATREKTAPVNSDATVTVVEEAMRNRTKHTLILVVHMFYNEVPKFILNLHIFYKEVPRFAHDTSLRAIRKLGYRSNMQKLMSTYF